MIPKKCLLTDKGKLLATLKGACKINCSTICKGCSYEKHRSTNHPYADYVMESWTKAILEEKNEIKIE